jgi:hypothetical protein
MSCPINELDTLKVWLRDWQSPGVRDPGAYGADMALLSCPFLGCGGGLILRGVWLAPKRRRHRFNMFTKGERK